MSDLQKLEQQTQGGERQPRSTMALPKLGSDLLLAAAVTGVCTSFMSPFECLTHICGAHYYNGYGTVPGLSPSGYDPGYPRRDFFSKKSLTARFAVFKKTVDHQGIQHLWRGNATTCLQMIPPGASVLALNDAIHSTLVGSSKSSSLGSDLFTGGAAGALVTAIWHPVPFARSYNLNYGRAQSTTRTYPFPRHFTGVVDCLATLVREPNGLATIYAAVVPSIAASCVFRAGQLGGFRYIQESGWNPYQGDKGPLGVIAAFAAVTVARTLTIPFSYPLGVVGGKMIRQAGLPVTEGPGRPGPRAQHCCLPQHVYKSPLECFTTVLKTDGVSGLYKHTFAVPLVFHGFGGSLIVVAYDRLKLIYNL